MFIYINGSIVHEKEATISAFDHGYMYGLGLFETFPVFDGHPFLLDDHFRRLHEGLQSIGIEWSVTREQATSMIHDLLKRNELKSAYVRWNVSAGPSEIGLYTGMYTEPTTIIYVKPLPSLQGQTKEGVILSTKRNTPEGDTRLKSHHYLNNVLAKREVGPAMHKEGIFLTESGHVAEGIVSNLFWIKNETIYTPAVQTGILNGITRQFVLAALEKQGLTVQEGLYKPEHLLLADAAFITNSIQEIVPLSSCSEAKYDTGHDIIAQLQTVFNRCRQRLWSRDELEDKYVT